MQLFRAADHEKIESKWEEPGLLSKMLKSVTYMFQGSEMEMKSKTVVETKKFFDTMDRDGSKRVTWGEYWHFVKSYLTWKGFKTDQILKE